MKLREIESAPKRGQYDRALSRRERQDAQRERVIGALAALGAADRELSIANVVELAGIGRNTFYEYFDDVDHALTVIKARALRELGARLDARLQVARTPLERVRGVARAWADALIANPPLQRLALRAQQEIADPAELSALGRHVVVVLSAQVEARSALPGLADPVRLTAVGAVFDSVSRAHLGSRSMSVDELHGVLADLALRLLR
jgi:AcrR family transcriptional regulator